MNGPYMNGRCDLMNDIRDVRDVAKKAIITDDGKPLHDKMLIAATVSTLIVELQKKDFDPEKAYKALTRII